MAAPKESGKQVPIQDYILSALVKMIKLELQVVASFTKTDDMSDVFKQLSPLERQGAALASLSLDTLTINHGGSGSSASSNVRQHALTHLGLRGSLVKGAPQSAVTFGDEGDNLVVTRANLIKAVPVNVFVTLRYAAVDETELMRFFAKWVFASANQRLNFKLNYAGIEWPVEIAMGDDLSVPDKPPKGEALGYRVYEGQLTIGGWYSNPDDKRDNSSVPVIHATTLEVKDA